MLTWKRERGGRARKCLKVTGCIRALCKLYFKRMEKVRGMELVMKGWRKNR